MSLYASATGVSVDRSKAEMEKLLLRYGADQFMSGTDMSNARAVVSFRYSGLPVRVSLSLPNPEDKAFRETPSGRRRRDEQSARREWEKACRQQWRVLRLLIQAQLEAIENKIVKPHEAFLPWIMLPNRKTVGEMYEAEILPALESGRMPKLLGFEEKGSGGSADA